jgi:hypothetical protein
MGSFANLHAGRIESNLPREKSCLLCTNCLLSLNQLLSVSAVNLSLCLICASCVICLLPAVSLCQPCCSCLCQSVSCCLLCLSECCLLSHLSLRAILVSHGLVSCLSNSAMNLLCLLCAQIVSYLTWTALGRRRSGLPPCRLSSPAQTPPAQSQSLVGPD